MAKIIYIIYTFNYDDCDCNGRRPWKTYDVDTPKVLHHVGGIPMLVWVIRTSLSLNPIKVLIVVGKYKGFIESCLQEYHVMENIEFVIQDFALGTGHAIQCCVPKLRQLNDSENVIILSGDVPLIQNPILDELISSKHMATIVTTIMKSIWIWENYMRKK